MKIVLSSNEACALRNLLNAVHAKFSIPKELKDIVKVEDDRDTVIEISEIFSVELLETCYSHGLVIFGLASCAVGSFETFGRNIASIVRKHSRKTPAGDEAFTKTA